MKWQLLAAAAVVACAGCGGPARIDGTSQVAYDRSIAAMVATMSVAEEEAFRKSLSTVALDGVEGLDELIEATASGRIRVSVDGMTAADIEAIASKIRERRAADAQ